MSDYFLGELRVFPYDRMPNGWLVCAGQVLQVTQYRALYSLLGAQYGGDGVKTFQLPDLRGVVPVAAGVSQALGLAYQVGNHGGTETVTLLPAQLPMHTHQLMAVSVAANQNSAAGNLMATIGNTADMTPQTYYGPGTSANIPLAPQTIGSVGGAPHSNVQPFLALNICISITGTYPTRQ